MVFPPKTFIVIIQFYHSILTFYIKFRIVFAWAGVMNNHIIYYFYRGGGSETKKASSNDMEMKANLLDNEGETNDLGGFP